jgi:molybdenum cofactor guanylyltransferase
VVAAGAGAERVIVVGPERAGLDGVIFVREEPPGSGPVPALRRGLAEVSEPLVAVLAADLPFFREEDLALLLRAAAEGTAGAVLVDDTDWPQWLAGCWRTEALRSALGAYTGQSLRGLFGPLEPVLVRAERAPGEPPPWLDCDTPADVEFARRLAGDLSLFVQVKTRELWLTGLRGWLALAAPPTVGTCPGNAGVGRLRQCWICLGLRPRRLRSSRLRATSMQR